MFGLVAGLLKVPLVTDSFRVSRGFISWNGKGTVNVRFTADMIARSPAGCHCKAKPVDQQSERGCPRPTLNIQNAPTTRPVWPIATHLYRWSRRGRAEMCRYFSPDRRQSHDT